jgi:hypothetical protein
MPKTSGRAKNANRLSSPPMDDPPTPVVSRPGRVRNRASTAGFIVSARYTTYSVARPGAPSGSSKGLYSESRASPALDTPTAIPSNPRVAA